MFIRHCPDKELSLVFKSKSAQSWTASEVQERLDEMLREQKATRRVACQQAAKVIEPVDNSPSLSPHRLETAMPATDNGALDKDKISSEGDAGQWLHGNYFACAVVPQLREAGVLDQELVPPSDIILVGCGGKQTCPVGMCDLKLEVYGLCFSVPVLIVSGQIDQLIVLVQCAENLIREMKSNDGFWRVLDKPDQSIQSEDCQFLRMLSSIERWRGMYIYKFGTLKSKSAGWFCRMSEHLGLGSAASGT
ncbi:hypothetical protein QQF64_034194 [Cirrhinus molitorella]|uniref:Uncharacterized protein n=1 Tax=Cirrhinus molitorella TaxID=172907 RepID=A0ABR3MW55_9TELE